MERYLDYRPSGVEWIGEVPSHWDVRRVKTLFEIVKIISGELGYEVLSVTQKGIRVKDLNSNEGQHSMDYSKYQIVRPGQFVMNHMDLLTGFVDLSKYVGVTSPDYRVFESKGNTFDGFYLYIFQMCYWGRVFYGLGQGVSTMGRWRLPSDEFLNFLLPFPPLPEQEEIVRYLDTKTQEIDQLVSITQKKIDLLKERRTSTINEVVTKGLNLNVERRDSGVEWIGEVPSHWVMTPLKRLVIIGNGKDFKEIEVEEGGYPVLGTGGEFTRCSEYLHTGPSVLLGRKGTVNNPLFINEPFWTSDTLYYTIIDEERVIPMFLYHSVRQIPFGLYSYGLIPSMTKTDYEEIKFPIPPLPEQEEIVRYLDTKTQEIDQLVSIEENRIKTLKEYRQSLISEVVTGKVKVTQN